MTGNRIALAGVALGVVGAVLLTLFVANADTGPDDEPARQVLVAAADLLPGTAAQAVAGSTEAVDVPQSLAPERALATLADVEGQEVLRRVGPGEILTRDMFAAPGPASGGVVVPAGWEAISLEAAPAPGLEGYATPGALVNVYATVRPEVLDPETGEPVPAESVPFTQLVLAHTEVLAVTRGTLTGDAADPSEQRVEGQMVFLLKVRPEDAPVLIHSQQHGQLWFTLANADDPSPVPQRVELDALAPDARQPAIDAARQQLEADRAARQAAPTGGEAATADPQEATR